MEHYLTEWGQVPGVLVRYGVALGGEDVGWIELHRGPRGLAWRGAAAFATDTELAALGDAAVTRYVLSLLHATDGRAA